MARRHRARLFGSKLSGLFSRLDHVPDHVFCSEHHLLLGRMGRDPFHDLAVNRLRRDRHDDSVIAAASSNPQVLYTSCARPAVDPKATLLVSHVNGGNRKKAVFLWRDVGGPLSALLGHSKSRARDCSFDRSLIAWRSLCARRFSPNFARGLIFSQPHKHGVPEKSIVRPAPGLRIRVNKDRHLCGK
jgi:hypothetical protein